MGWRETRSAARDKVHSAFAVPAVYTPPGGGSPIDVHVRQHSRVVAGGEFQNDGYASQMVDVNRIVFDTQEVQPARKATVEFETGDIYYLELFERLDEDRYEVWNVTRSRA